jgi:hypothetical protein
MALWGNKDSKSATGTIAIGSNGAVTGSSTLFTTEAVIGNTIRADGRDYVITTITSNTAATVQSGIAGGAITAVTGGTSYTLSEKPVFVAEAESSGSDSGVHGDSNKVFGVDTTESSAGGDNVAEVGISCAGARYLEAPAVTFSGGGGSSAAATATIAGGVVTAITVTNTGTAYTSTPTVAIAKPRRTIPTSGITTGTDTIAYTAHGLNAGDVLVYNNGGGTSATGLTSGTTYYVIASGLTANAFKVSATDGGTTVDITGTGNNAQFFEIFAVVNQATAVADLGSGAGGSQVTHAGWVRRTVGTGGRAGRIQYETLVAAGSISADQSDDIQFRDS